MGLELQDAEGHPADLLAFLVRIDLTGVYEVADSERGGLLFGDRLDGRCDRHPVTGSEVACVALLAIGRDHRRVAVIGQQAV